jgi:DNA helicase-2/ATP-dependent DNA helicase PcrA
MPVTLDDLVGPQQTAFACRDRRVLIVGGPGSGKTLVALFIARRIVDEDVAGRRVLFLTFSRAATSELTSRMPALFKGTAGQRIEVTTFHSFALGVLDAFRRFAGGPEQPVTIATREETELNVAAPGSVEFDDIVPTTLELFRAAPWILGLQRERLAAVICDEFQDTRDDFFALLEAVAQGRQLICLADPDQMIFDGLPGAASIARRIEAYRATGPTEIDLGAVSYRDPSQVIPRAAAAIRDARFADPDLRAALDAKRVTIDRVAGPVRDHVVEAIRVAVAGGAESVGVFFATNKQVNEFADRLRRDGLDHEIVGLSHASGEAELATAFLARFAVGLATWDEVLQRLGVFLASTVRGTPPPVARQMVLGDRSLDPGLARLLHAERDSLSGLTERTVGELIAEARAMWPRVFTGGQRLWELGLDDLANETASIAHRLLDASVVEELAAIASKQRTVSAIDSLPANRAPIRVMNLYQIKGRQMDVSFTVREPGDREPRGSAEAQRLGRLIFVAVSRARQRAGFIFPVGVTGYFGQIARLR